LNDKKSGSVQQPLKHVVPLSRFTYKATSDDIVPNELSECPVRFNRYLAPSADKKNVTRGAYTSCVHTRTNPEAYFRDYLNL
jgi:hypothetical protein